jgi:hypothetical protein
MKHHATSYINSLNGKIKQNRKLKKGAIKTFFPPLRNAIRRKIARFCFLSILSGGNSGKKNKRKIGYSSKERENVLQI